MHLMPPRWIAKVERAVMEHPTACIIRTIHADRLVIGSIIHIHHDGLLPRELMKQLVDKRFYVKYAT